MTDKDKLNQLKTHADAEDKRIDNLEKRLVEIEKEKKTKLKEEKEKQHTDQPRRISTRCAIKPTGARRG